MTRIIYDRDGLSLSMEGHALAGSYGQDIVCAAESMLIMCLEKRLLDFGEAVRATVRKGPGRFYIEAAADEKHEKRCRESFDTIFAGFKLLSEYEPEHVQARELYEEGETR